MASQKIQCGWCRTVIRPSQIEQTVFICPECGRQLEGSELYAEPRDVDDRSMSKGIWLWTKAFFLVALSFGPLLIPHMNFGRQFEAPQKKPSKSRRYAVPPTINVHRSAEPNFLLSDDTTPRFRFETQDHHVYRISVRSGSSEFEADYEFRVINTAPDPRDQKRRSGGAFVVSPDGYLIAPLHLVEHSEKINTWVNDSLYQAFVVDANPDLGLALLHIQASELAKVKFREADVPAGTPMTAIGPVTGVKARNSSQLFDVTTGAMCERCGGRNQLEVESEVQDTPGAIMIDHFADVAGMVDRTVYETGQAHSTFVIPAADIRKYLRSCGMASLPSQDSEKLSALNAHERIRPSVVLVASIGASQHCHEIQYTATVQAARNVKNVRRGTIMQGRIFVNELGAVVGESRTGLWLPHMPRAVETLIFNPVDEWNRRKWVATDFRKSRFATGLNERFSQTYRLDSVMAIGADLKFQERFVGNVTDIAVPALARIHYDYEFIPCGHKAPAYIVAGELDVTFDVERGMPIEGGYEGTVGTSAEVTTDVTYSFRRLDNPQ